MHVSLVRTGLLLACAALGACSGGGAESASGPIPQGSTLAAQALPPTSTTRSASDVTAQSSYTYTAPWGGYSGAQIYVEPAGACSYIAASLAAGYSWPAFLATLKQGTTITIAGTPSYANTWSEENGCPTGGIVATKVTEGGVASKPSPTPAPQPTGSSGSSGGIAFGNVAPNYEPPATWRPYTSSSTWNQRLANPDNPTRDPNDYAMIQAMFNSAFGPNTTQGRIATPATTAVSRDEGGGGLPYYFARTSDPAVVINCTAGYGTCVMQGKTYHVPAKAMPAQDADHHMVVVQPDGTELDVWEWGVNLRNSSTQNPPWYGNETINVGWGGVANVTSGTGWESSATASGADGLAGIVHESELAAGKIEHALQANVYCSPTTNYVYPALKSSGSTNCHGFSMSANQITPMGSRLWIDLTDAQIDSLSTFDAAQKTVLHALHDYGAFVTENSGYDPLGFNAIESQIPGAAYGDDVVGTWAAAKLPAWFSWEGLNWYEVFLNTDMDNTIKPHLHVLAPCVNVGYPGTRCS